MQRAKQLRRRLSKALKKVEQWRREGAAPQVSERTIELLREVIKSERRRERELMEAVA